MILEENRVEMSVRLLQNGKYTWSIAINSPLKDAQGGIEILGNIDSQLRDKFPNHVQVSSAKAFEFKSEDADLF